MGDHRQRIGRWGEQLAADFLAQKGYQILGKNLRTPHGEIDILASINQILVFVEVKTRTSHEFGDPENSITSRKLNHMDASAQFITQQMDFTGTWQWDAISILKRSSEDHEIIHFENVIS